MTSEAVILKALHGCGEALRSFYECLHFPATRIVYRKPLDSMPFPEDYTSGPPPPIGRRFRKICMARTLGPQIKQLLPRRFAARVTFMPEPEQDVSFRIFRIFRERYGSI